MITTLITMMTSTMLVVISFFLTNVFTSIFLTLLPPPPPHDINKKVNFTLNNDVYIYQLNKSSYASRAHSVNSTFIEALPAIMTDQWFYHFFNTSASKPGQNINVARTDGQHFIWQIMFHFSSPHLYLYDHSLSKDWFFFQLLCVKTWIQNVLISRGFVLTTTQRSSVRWPVICVVSYYLNL